MRQHDREFGHSPAAPHHHPPHSEHGGWEGHHGGSGGGGRHGHGGRGQGRHGGGGSHFGGGRDRARRGEARYVLLDALRDGPKHGYEIIKYLEERSSGEYAPSPGTVYPTLQFLEDAGQVCSEQSAERRVYHLTEGGRAELEARAEDLNAFWARLAGPPASGAQRHPEVEFVAEELDALGRTVWGGLRGALDRNDLETVRRVRQTIERCRGEVRQIIAESASRPGQA